jgi:choline dehydrogenase-like flavoprotein
MLIDGRTLPDGQLLDTDLCIIGAGAAGISLALAFAGDPDIAVCLVESGGFEFDPDIQELYRGTTVGLPYEAYETRLRQFGGTTNHWGGLCRPLEESDFAPRPWVPYSGWPIRRADLDPYYGAAAVLCEVDGLGGTAELWSERVGRPALDLEKSGLRNLIFVISPPTRFGEVYRDRVLAAANLTLCLNSSVIGFERPAGGRTVERVRVAGTLADNRFQIRARCFVLACGGIENARLLLCSKRAADGLPDPHDLVGRFFMEHSHFDLGRLVPSQDRDWQLYLVDNPVTGANSMKVNCHLGLRPEVEAAAGIGSVAVQIRPRLPSLGEKSLQHVLGALEQGRYPEDLGAHLHHVLQDLDEIGGVIGGKLLHRLLHNEGHATHLALRSVGEQVPDPDSRVMLAETTDALGLPEVLIDWRLSELDRFTLKRTGEILAEEFGRLGLGRMQPAFTGEDGAAPEFIEWGFHHMGTTRMHDEPRRGVVDRHCRLHVADNFYVAGSSVFPTGGGGTPTITIVALALRLADHLKTEVFA